MHEIAVSYLWTLFRVPKDIDKGLYWLRRAAELGYEESRERLHMTLKYGMSGVPQDTEEAEKWAPL